MTTQVNIAEAKARLSELVARAEAGEDIVLARAGKPAIRLVPAGVSERPRKHAFIGALEHLGPVSDEFLDLFLEPDTEYDPDKSIFPE
ncbi:MAG: type II toxin-antitoxin system Phd/YefM family antitoxin [Brevundimonas sp.]|uniref:type II toxin-antitoxin system Phd/YefM family antitoxin n=1 Tax=Brevundimonas sp. TaxID=1871086 RepID=UPI00391AF4B0